MLQLLRAKGLLMTVLRVPDSPPTDPGAPAGKGAPGPGRVEAGALTFEGFVDVAAEVIDPVGVVEFWVPPSGDSILCDIN